MKADGLLAGPYTSTIACSGSVRRDGASINGGSATRWDVIVAASFETSTAFRGSG